MFVYVCVCVCVSTTDKTFVTKLIFAYIYIYIYYQLNVWGHIDFFFKLKKKGMKFHAFQEINLFFHNLNQNDYKMITSLIKSNSYSIFIKESIPSVYYRRTLSWHLLS